MAESGGQSYTHLLIDCFDPDELKEAIDGTQIAHRLLPGGELQFDLQRLKLASGTLDCGMYGPAILAEGCFPEKVVAVGMVVEGPAPVLSNGEFHRRHSVQLYAEGAELTYRSSPETQWMSYTIDRGALQESVLELTGRPLPIPESGSISLDPTPEAGARLARTVSRTLSEGASASRSSQWAAHASRLEERLHHDIAVAVASTQSDQRRSRIARERARRQQIVRRAEEYLRAHLAEPFSLSGLADATGVGPRQVQYHFRKIYGLTPLAWFRSRKLARIREELKRRGRSETRVTDVAMSWGCYRLGRFSREYRNLFGESPSETLRH